MTNSDFLTAGEKSRLDELVAADLVNNAERRRIRDRARKRHHQWRKDNPQLQPSKD